MKTIHYIVIICFFLIPPQLCNSAEKLYQSIPSVTPQLAKPGGYMVGVTTLSLTHPKQLNPMDFVSTLDRKLVVEVWYPARATSEVYPAIYNNVTRLHKPFAIQGTSYRDASPLDAVASFPLVIMSHGYTGYRTLMFYLGEHLASHGYVVVAIDHTDSTNADVDVIKAPLSGFISTLYNRSRDQQFVLDFFTANNNHQWQMIDRDKAALIGYSMGGYGAINTMGGCYAFTTEFLQQIGFPGHQADAAIAHLNFCRAGRESVDQRWKAMIAIAPWGGEQQVHRADTLAKIRVPALFVAGDQDDISGYDQGVKKLYQQLESKDSYLLVFENARHNIAAHPAPRIVLENEIDIGHYYEPAWEIQSLNAINMHMALAFFDCYIKRIQDSCAYLPQRETITQIKQADGSMTPAWPGFPDRWGTGVRFIRKHVK